MEYVHVRLIGINLIGLLNRSRLNNFVLTRDFEIGEKIKLRTARIV